MQNDHLQNMPTAYCKGLQSSGLPETVWWACCLSCGRICCARGCNGMKTAHFCPVSTTPTSLECGFAPILSRGILSCFCLYVASSSSETLCMKPDGWNLALFATRKSLQGTFCWTCFENSLVCGLCASKTGSLDNALEFVKSMLEK